MVFTTKKEKVLKIDSENEQFTPLKPFLRWAGGKQNLVSKLIANLPNHVSGQYYEPFLGAGSLFFAQNFKKATISDINPHLINCYNQIKKSAIEVSDILEYHRKKISPEYYYKLRTEFNQRRDYFTEKEAATFIFLIHTSFNGIYRVNQKGEYNVPFGKQKAAIPEKTHLLKVQEKLKNVEIKNYMYQDILNEVKKGDFVYLDPPYPPLNNTSNFQHYSIDKFPSSQQEELSIYANKLNEIGAKIMISNAEIELIKNLYKGWNLNVVKTYRYINCKTERKKVNELIITNY